MINPKLRLAIWTAWQYYGPDWIELCGGEPTAEEAVECLLDADRLEQFIPAELRPEWKAMTDEAREAAVREAVRV